MKARLSVLAVVVCLATTGATALAARRAAPQPAPTTPAGQSSTTSPPSTAPASRAIPDRAYLVVNLGSGETIYNWNERERLPMASLTKMMTVLVALEHLELRDVVTVSKDASAIGESTIDLQPGEKLSVRDLVVGALVQSANDAAVALADAASGGDRTKFVAWMNEKAAELGLRDTRYKNPDGLDQPGHFSSAQDVLALARVVMRNGDLRKIVAMVSGTIAGGRAVHTWNNLLTSYPGTFGVKTGHTDDAGWCEVASVQRDGTTLYAVVLGSSSEELRDTVLASLLSNAFRRYRTLRVVDTETVYGHAVDPATGRRVALVSPKPVFRVVRRDRPLVVRFAAVPKAQLHPGEPLGEVRVYNGGKLIATQALVPAPAGKETTG